MTQKSFFLNYCAQFVLSFIKRKHTQRIGKTFNRKLSSFSENQCFHMCQSGKVVIVKLHNCITLFCTSHKIKREKTHLTFFASFLAENDRKLRKDPKSHKYCAQIEIRNKMAKFNLLNTNKVSTKFYANIFLFKMTELKFTKCINFMHKLRPAKGNGKSWQKRALLLLTW